MRLQRTFHSVDLVVSQKAKDAAASGSRVTRRTGTGIAVKSTLGQAISVKNRRNAELLIANWHFARKMIAYLAILGRY